MIRLPTSKIFSLGPKLGALVDQNWSYVVYFFLFQNKDLMKYAADLSFQVSSLYIYAYICQMSMRATWFNASTFLLLLSGC